MPKKPFRNRRKHIRVIPAAEKPIAMDINGENFIDTLRAVDISEGGTGIVVPHRFEGCEIDKKVSIVVELPLPEMKHLFLVHAQIRHITQSKFGVVFLDLKKDHRQLIRSYIREMIKVYPWHTQLLHALHML